MPATPEALARETIDRLLIQAGWLVFDRAAADIGAGRGVAIREFALETGYADYLLYVDGKAIGAIEAKKEGTPLAGVEPQTAKYGVGLPAYLPAWSRPLPFLYESTGVETFFTNGLEPEARARRVFAFHQPAILAEWVSGNSRARMLREGGGDIPAAEQLRARLRQMPPLNTTNLWRAQIEAITNLEKSLAENRPRALIQMATGSGKTFTAVSAIYRLIKFGGAKRIVFLVDRNNLGRQTLAEFRQYRTPDDGRLFTELYNVQHLQSNHIDPVCKVVITSIQRLYSMLRGEAEFDPANEDRSLNDVAWNDAQPREVAYNSAIPIEQFDFIVTDECHRSIYNLWRGVLEYFDAFIIGLTATPNKQTFGFFHQNLVMEYGRRQAVLDRVNVDGEVYRIRTQITEQGGAVEAGFWVGKRERLTRKQRWEQLDEPLTYTSNQLDREVVAENQIRTVLRTFRDKVLTEIFPTRTEVPKTLIFAKDDNHAEDIVRIVREEFGRGNEFCQKITYRADEDSETLISRFRNEYYPRIAVTVDMIATGTDIKPLEILLFLRQVQSAGLFEQMLGRGTRVLTTTELQRVTPDATEKTRFVIVDAVGVVDNPKVDVGTLDRKRAIAFEKLVEQVGLGRRDEDTFEALARRLARLEGKLSDADRKDVLKALEAGGVGLQEAERLAPLGALAQRLIAAFDPDGRGEASADGISEIANGLAADASPQQAARPFEIPKVREVLFALHRKNEIVVDEVSQDTVLSAGFDTTATERARATIESFRQFIEQHKDEIAALQLIFNRPRTAQPLAYEQIEELARQLELPPRNWTTQTLWDAYARLERDRVRGANAPRALTDVIALVRHAVQMDDELIPYPDQVQARYAEWLTAQQAGGRTFTADQRWWLDQIAAHIGQNAAITADDLGMGEFFNHGGVFKARAVFGAEWGKVLDELNGVLA